MVVRLALAQLGINQGDRVGWLQARDQEERDKEGGLSEQL